MAFPSVTNTFVNGASADAGEVNTNFTDVINGLSDGTKDFSMSAGTLAGVLTCNGNVVLGNGTGDDITITGSLAATLNIKTDGTFDLGTTAAGLRVGYFGDAGGNTVGIQAPAIASNFLFTLPGFTTVMPAADGTSGHVMRTNASGTLAFSTDVRDPESVHNYGITVTMGSSAATIALVGSNGSDASATNVIEMMFRNATITTGTPSVLTVSGALSAVIDSGGTMGAVSAQKHKVYIYAINNAGTIELAVSSLLVNDNELVTTTVLSTGSDSATTIYSEVARTGVGIRLLGHFISTQATAGTWATAAAEIYVGRSGDTKAFDSAVIEEGAKILDTNHLLADADFPNSTSLYGWHNNGLADYDDGDWVGGEALTEVGALLTGTNHLGDTAFCGFDGTNDALYANSATFDTANEDFTVGAWVKITDYSSNRTLFSKTSTTNSEKSFYVYLGSTGPLVMQVFYNASGAQNGHQAEDVGVELTDGNYHHVVCSYDTSVGSFLIMIDGKTRAYGISSDTINARNNNTTAKLTFGSQDGSGTLANQMLGEMTEAFYKKVAMTPNEIRKVYAGGCQKLAVQETANVNASKVSILDGRRTNGWHQVNIAATYTVTASWALVTGHALAIPEDGLYRVTALGATQMIDSDGNDAATYLGLYRDSTAIAGSRKRLLYAADNTTFQVRIQYALEVTEYFAKDEVVATWATMDTGDNCTIPYSSGDTEPTIVWEKLD